MEIDLPADELLTLMLGIEADFGRVRTSRNAPRILDLDLIAYHDRVIKQDDFLIVPHPRMHERGFVLNPLREIAKNWVHPVSGLSIEALVATLPAGQEAKIIEQEAVV